MYYKIIIICGKLAFFVHDGVFVTQNINGTSLLWDLTSFRKSYIRKVLYYMPLYYKNVLKVGKFNPNIYIGIAPRANVIKFYSSLIDIFS